MEAAATPSPWMHVVGGQVWRCHGCGQGLGVIVENTLIVGVTLAIQESVRVRCMVCGHNQRWRTRLPADERRGATALKTVG